ncbi:peptidoglycan-binding protein [Sinomicrobium pectinilyticum]|uniref:Peptidoglycan-binding protein n=1 Tax=Sinomicrobium pectinilyticum TaxID=1084421 RepID=A0A3N0EMN6_SINP1|nr:peptidoglycan-binding protein [Sinomicrobium pectinilyticum]RNL89032.1 peptidoglycan-binding protein [Sinomicrobium pectinilyticum]
MATRMYLPGWLYLLILGYGHLAFANDVSTLRRVYTAEVGVKEATGQNDGKRIAEYLRYTGLGEGYEWCAAFVSFCFGKAGYAEPRTPWSPALFPERKVIRTKKEALVSVTLKREPVGEKAQKTPRAGDVFGLYNTRLGRIAHAGFIDRWTANWAYTVEGNVANAVVRKRRPVRTLTVIARWTDD